MPQLRVAGCHRPTQVGRFFGQIILFPNNDAIKLREYVTRGNKANKVTFRRMATSSRCSQHFHPSAFNPNLAAPMVIALNPSTICSIHKSASRKTRPMRLSAPKRGGSLSWLILELGTVISGREHNGVAKESLPGRQQSCFDLHFGEKPQYHVPRLQHNVLPSLQSAAKILSTHPKHQSAIKLTVCWVACGLLFKQGGFYSGFVFAF